MVSFFRDSQDPVLTVGTLLLPFSIRPTIFLIPSLLIFQGRPGPYLKFHSHLNFLSEELKGNMRAAAGFESVCDAVPWIHPFFPLLMFALSKLDEPSVLTDFRRNFRRWRLCNFVPCIPSAGEVKAPAQNTKYNTRYGKDMGLTQRNHYKCATPRFRRCQSSETGCTWCKDWKSVWKKVQPSRKNVQPSLVFRDCLQPWFFAKSKYGNSFKWEKPEERLDLINRCLLLYLDFLACQRARCEGGLCGSQEYENCMHVKSSWLCQSRVRVSTARHIKENAERGAI